jgi:Immunoglobulin domain
LFENLKIVPPVIEPFSFQDGLAEGMRTRIICGVARGDLPLRLIWLKDGETLMPLLGANVSSLDQYTSILSISSLSNLNSGEYTCVASNQASEVRYTASLKVKGNVKPLSRFENQKFSNCFDPSVKILIVCEAN